VAETESYRALCPSVPSSVLPNGINVAEYHSQPNDPTILRLRPEALVILFLSRLHPIKGADKLIKAFFRVCKEVPNAILVMAGPDEFMIEDKFRAVVKRNGLQERILFPGMVEGKIKKDLLARADLFCLPSAAEGFSMAILEALASATAVMISPGCHFPEAETEGVGRVVEAEPEAMSKAIIELLKDRKQLQEMGRKGREFVLRDYSWDTVASELVDIYREGIARHSRTNHR
jgi:Glycosyltransferase